MQVKKLVVFGLGQRGHIFATYAKKYPQQFLLTAIIENNPIKIEQAKKEYVGVPIYTDYKAFLETKTPADLVAVATQDEQHKEHAVAMMQAGYDLLLEKPIANHIEDCYRIYEASKLYNRKVIVCHVLRYTPFYSTVKRIIDSGKLGDIVTIHASENVGYFHQAHSFVRGPWRNKEQSSPMILAKCCHDMDIIRYLMGVPCVSVNSYGDLYYFHSGNAPANSTQYCSDCPCEDCMYKAQTLYTDTEQGWCAHYFLKDEWTKENVLRDLKGTQYDRCVFKCDNDVVDHQVTVMRFEGGKTACHTMTAFSKEIYRDLKVHGTKAELVGVVEKNFIEIRNFGGEVERVNIDVSDATVGGHMGGDYFMMKNVYNALNGQPAEGISYLDVSIESHLMSFGAETSRLNDGKTVKIEK